MDHLNFRDVGGVPTTTGGWVRRGALFRSAAFDSIHAAGHQHLSTFGICRIIDLRAAQEIRGGLLEWTGCQRFHLPLIEEIPGRWSAPVDRTPEATAARYLEIAESGRAALVRILELLSECDRRPTLMHCVAGRDRTGIVVACVLDLLGVDDDAVVADYALSSVMDDADGHNAHPENIRGMLRLVRENYGSTAGMLRRFGAADQSLTRLAAALVVAGAQG